MVLSAILGAASKTIGHLANTGKEAMASGVGGAGGEAAAAAMKPAQNYRWDTGERIAKPEGEQLSLFDRQTGLPPPPPKVPGVGDGAKAAKGGGDVGNIMKGIGKLLPGGDKPKGPLSEVEQKQLKMWDDETKSKRQRDRFAKESVKHSDSMGAKMQKGMKTMGGKAGMLGISASVSSLMRQSQLFTGIMGAFFQVVGAFIDVLLAPFMPGLFKMVAMLAKGIPWAQKFSKIVFKILETVLFKPVGFAIGLYIKYVKMMFKIYGWLFGQLWKGIQWGFGKIGEFWKWITSFDVVKSIMEAIKSTWNWLKNPGEWFSGPLHPFKKMFAVISGIIGFIVSIFKGVWDWLKELPFAIGEFFISIKNKLVEIWNGMTGWFGDVFEWLGGAFKTGWTTIKDALSWVWDKGKMVFTWYTDTLKMVLNFYMDALAWVWDTGKLAWAWIVDTVQKGWDTLVSAGEWVWGAFKTGWTTIKDWVVGAFKTAWEAMKATADWISGAFKTAWEGLKDGLAWLWGAFKTGWNTMKDGLAWLWGSFKTGWNTLKGWVGDAKDILVDKVKRVVVWFWTTGKGFLKFYKDLLLKIGGYIIGGFFTIKDLVYKYIVQPLGRMWDWLTTKPWAFIQDVFGSVVDFFKGILTFDWLKTGIIAIVSFLEKVFTALGGIGIKTFWKTYKPFGALEGVASTLTDLINTIEGTRTGTGGTTENLLRIKIETNGGLGMPAQTSQQLFSSKHAEAEIIMSSIRFETDVDSSGWSPYMSGAR